MAEILLFFPELLKNQTPLLPPLELMALVPGLKSARFSVEIWDQRVVPFSQKTLEEKLDGCRLVGISCRPGGQVLQSCRFARAVKEVAQDIPVLFGGWFPTNVPERVAAHPAVDYVITGEGETSVVQLAQALKENRDPVDVPGLCRFHNGIFQKTPQNSPSGFKEQPSPDYSALNIADYIGPARELSYISSKGCDAECRFCAIRCQYDRGWFPLPADRVIEEVSDLARRYELKSIRFVDANVFGEEDRTVAILNGFKERGLRLQWRGAGRIDTLLAYKESSWEIIRDSGCYGLEAGVESGSDRVLDSMQKNLTLEQIREFAEKAAVYKIPVTYNFILG